MSLLNLASDGLPNILVSLAASIHRTRRPLARTELLAKVAPEGVAHEDGKMARQTLNRWVELGLFEQVDGAVRLAQPLDAANDDATFLTAVRKAARRRALCEENNSDLWANVQARAADFTRSMAWLLAQDVYRFSFGDIEALEASQVVDTDARLMRNNVRQNGLKYWGHFLGFLREPGGGHIDPTCAIRESLGSCLPDEKGLPALDFVRNLADKIPVLDGGRWRLAVEDRLNRQALPAMAEGQLSTSLSRALRNLSMEGILVLENRADVGSAIVLTGRDGPRADYRYTWVRLDRPTRSLRS